MKQTQKPHETVAEKTAQSPAKEGRRRRTKNDSNNRNFLCGCGKSYLSYPALYTHLKQKHGGVQPEGTVLPQVKFSSRSKTNKSNNSNTENKPEVSNNESCTGNSSLQEDEEGLRDFLKFFERYGKMYPKEELTAELATPLSRAPDLVSCIKAFPKEFFEKQEDYLPIYSSLEEIEKNQKLFAGFNDKSKKKWEIFTQPINCNKIFAMFLFEISRFIRTEWFKEIAFFVCLLRKTLNLIGWKTINRSPQEEKEFCESNTAQSILECSNEFITSCLPSFLSEFESLEFELLGKEEEKIKNAVFFTQFLGNWLFFNGYTTIRIKKNYEDPE